MAEYCDYCGFEIKHGKKVYVDNRAAHAECAVLAGDLEEDQIEEDDEDYD